MTNRPAPEQLPKIKLPAKYNRLTIKERRTVREEYVRKQNGRCMFCNELLTDNPPDKIASAKINWSLFPRGKGFLDYPVHLQHCHTSGLTEGAVHALCNAYMWEYEGR